MYRSFYGTTPHIYWTYDVQTYTFVALPVFNIPKFFGYFS